MKRNGLTFVLVVTALAAFAENARAQWFRFRPRPSPSRTATVDRARHADHALLKFIEQQQRMLVRESWGEEAYQCFTDVDLRMLREDLASDERRQVIRTMPEFHTAVEALRKAGADEREAVFDAASLVYRPTWRQLGRIDRAGQTDAGQQGDILVGRLIIDLAKQELAALPSAPQPRQAPAHGRDKAV